MQIAAFIRDAGTSTTRFDGRAHLLRTEADLAGLTAIQVLLELAIAFHHAARSELTDAGLQRLHTLSRRAAVLSYVPGAPLTRRAGQSARRPHRVRNRGHGPRRRPPRGCGPGAWRTGG